MLPPQRGAHFPYLGMHEHVVKMSSRCCAVRLLKNELSLLRGAFFYTHLRKTNVFGAPGPPGLASLDVPRCSRRSVVHIVVENGAVATASAYFHTCEVMVTILGCEMHVLPLTDDHPAAQFFLYVHFGV